MEQGQMHPQGQGEQGMVFYGKEYGYQQEGGAEDTAGVFLACVV